eukprot:TRINITY_DN3453_c1_g1_i1.p1 TRINITY_DN3453_c1_g1~~TRINITY_DN3453_c1_g1_i1.p1  ORF type:complete len:3069 (+),score=1153.21 TRINITY_DN3453_c1_g1_i1:1073-9208(+)
MAMKVVPDKVDRTATMLPHQEYGLVGFMGSLITGPDPNQKENFYIIRYENKPSQLSPLSNSVAWLCEPDKYFSMNKNVFGVRSSMPAPGVFEYLESRPHEEVLPPRDEVEQRWQAHPWENESAEELIKKCYAEPNQSRYNDSLHMRVIELLEGFAVNGPLRKTMEAKLNNADGKPTPQDIAHALELQTLRWGKKEYFIALSGCPRIITDTKEPHDLANLYRVYHECQEQPYFLLNETMRNKQIHTGGPFQASVEVSCPGKGVSGKYLAKELHSEEADTVRTPLTFVHESVKKNSIRWNTDDEIWDLYTKTDVTGRVEHESTKMRLGLWMLNLARPLMWYLANSLRTIPRESGPVKSYRGLANAVLPRDSYMQGGLVMWGAYSSSSVDQATATWFATQEKSAAVFTLRGRSCILVAPWSRFAREKEYLYPPNTCFQVKTLLTEDQQQLLGREELQLYELDEVDDNEALTIYITQIINSAITGQGMGLVDQLVSVVQFLVNKQLLKALKRVLSPQEPVLTQTYGLDVARRLRDLAEIDEDLEDVCCVLQEALWEAASTGQDESAKCLFELGAGPGDLREGGWNSIDQALIGGHRSTAELLLELAGMGSAKEYVRRTDGDTTLLHRMAELGHQKGVLLLIDLKADREALDKSKNTPASLAFHNGRKEIVHLLLPHKTLPPDALQEMITYWGSSHYSCEESRERFTEQKEALVCVGYGTEWDGSFYDTVHREQAETFEIIEGMKTWRTPRGLAWEESTVNDLLQDARFFRRNHYRDQDVIAMPLFLHTSSVYHRLFWAVWVSQPEQVVGGMWKPLDALAIEALETARSACHGTHDKGLTLPQCVVQELSLLLGAASADEQIPTKLDCVSSSKSSSLEAFVAPIKGARPSDSAPTPGPPDDVSSIASEAVTDLGSLPRSLEGRVQLVRFHKAEGLASMGLTASVAWVPKPEVAFSETHPYAADRMQHLHGLLEYIYSRDPREDIHHFDSSHNKNAIVTSVRCAEFTDLARRCQAQQNPHELNEELHKEFTGLTSPEALREPNKATENFTPDEMLLLRAVMREKIRPDAHLTPEMMAQALSLQWLRIGKELHLMALSGCPKVIARLGVVGPRQGRAQVASLFRVCRPWAFHPGDYVNITAGNLGRKDLHTPRLEIENGPRQVNGVYEMQSEDLMHSPSNLTGRNRNRKATQQSVYERSMSLKSDQIVRASDDTHSIFEGTSSNNPTSTLAQMHQRVGTPARSHISTGLSSTADRQADSDAEEWFYRIDATQHTARWVKRKWIIYTGGVPREQIAEELVSMHIGIYMKDHVWPLLTSIHAALSDLPTLAQLREKLSPVPDMLYRASVGCGAGSVVHSDKEDALIWTSMTPVTTSRTLASSMVVGENATVIKLRSRSARYIAPYSRFVREDEWMVLPNVVFRFDAKGHEFGVNSLQLSEVEETDAMVMSIRFLITSQLTAASSWDDRKKMDALMRVISDIETRKRDDALRHLLHPTSTEKPLIRDAKVFDIARKMLSAGASQAVLHEELSFCSQEGYMQCVAPLLQLGADANYKSKTYQYNPVGLAIMRGHLDIYKTLRPNPADWCPPPSTLFEYAAEGRELAVWLLHQVGASLTAVDSMNKTPAHVAHENQKWYTVFLIKILLSDQQHNKGVPVVPREFLPALLDNNSDTIEEVVTSAIRKGAVDACDAIVRALSPELRKRLLEGLRNGRTCLHEAAQNTQHFGSGRGLQVLKSIMNYLPELVHKPDLSRSTPLTAAIKAHNVEMVHLFIKMGADIRAEDIDGMSPVHHAYDQDERCHPEDPLRDQYKEIRCAFDHQLKLRVNEAGKRFGMLPCDTQMRLRALGRSLAAKRPRPNVAMDGSVGSPQEDDQAGGHRHPPAQPEPKPKPQGGHDFTAQDDDYYITKSAVAAVAWGGSQDARANLDLGIFMNMQPSLTLQRFCDHFLAYGPVSETDEAVMNRIETWENSGSGYTLAQVIQEEEESRRLIERDQFVLNKGMKVRWDDIKYTAHSLKPRIMPHTKYPLAALRVAFHVAMLLSVLYTSLLLAAGIGLDGVSTVADTASIAFDTIVDINFLIFFVLYVYELHGIHRENARKDRESPEDNDADKRSFFRKCVMQNVWFWLAFIPVWPLQLIRVAMGDSYGSTLSEPLWRANKLLSVLNLHKGKQYYREKYDPNEFIVTFVQLVAGIVYSMYFISCLLTALDVVVLKSHSLEQNFFFLMRNMLGRDSWKYSGDSPVHEDNAGLVFLKLLLKMLGTLYQAAYITAFIRLCSVYDLRRQMYIEKVDNVSDSLREMHPVVRSIALDYYKRLWIARGHVFLPQSSDVVSELSPSLGDALMLEMTKNVKQEFTYFQTFNHDKLRMIVANWRHMVCPKRSVVCTKGEEGKCMYFIVAGRFGVYKGGSLDLKTGVWNPGESERIAELGKGEFFGERSILPSAARMVSTDNVRNANVVALEHSEVYVLERATLQQVGDTRDFPEMVTELVRVCAERTAGDPLTGNASMLRGDLGMNAQRGSSDANSAPPDSPQGPVSDQLAVRRNQRLFYDQEETRSLLNMSPQAYSALRHSTDGESLSQHFPDAHDVASHDSLPDAAARVGMHRDRLGNPVSSASTGHSTGHSTNFSQTMPQVSQSQAPPLPPTTQQRRDRGSNLKRTPVARKVLTNPLVAPSQNSPQGSLPSTGAPGYMTDVGSTDHDSVHSFVSEITSESGDARRQSSRLGE